MELPGAEERDRQKVSEFPAWHCTLLADRIIEIHPGREDGLGPGSTLVLAHGRRVSVGEKYPLPRESFTDPSDLGFYLRYEDGGEDWCDSSVFHLRHKWKGGR